MAPAHHDPSARRLLVTVLRLTRAALVCGRVRAGGQDRRFAPAFRKTSVASQATLSSLEQVPYEELAPIASSSVTEMMGSPWQSVTVAGSCHLRKAGLQSSV